MDDDAHRVSADERTAAATWEALFRTQVVVLRRLQGDPVWGQVSMREYDVLFVLVEGGGALRLRELTEGILLAQSSVSRLVERMERRGLVTRSTPADDARGTLVTITDLGRRLQRETGAEHVRAIGRYVGEALDGEQQAQLRSLLEILRAAQADIPPVERRAGRGRRG
jgi:DNA-binding MarR family transcriptional regulator